MSFKQNKHIERTQGLPQWFSLAAVLVFALIQRLILYTGVLDYDVLKYANLASNAAAGHITFDLDLSSVFFRYSLYLPVALLYKLFGPSEFTTTLYPLLISLAGICSVYGIARIAENEKAGLFAALIWSAFPLNVFLSTLFGPDSILANFLIISTFFLFFGEKSQGRKRRLSFLAALIFLAVAITVKPSAIIGSVFIGMYGLLRLWQWQRDALSNKWRGLSQSHRYLAIGLVSVLMLFGVLTFLKQNSFPLLHLFFLASSDLSNLFVLGKTQEYFPVVGRFFKTNLFVASAPLFIIAAAVIARKANRLTGLVLTWASSLFFYFEWGSLSTNPLIYAPFVARVGDRNALFIFAPLAVLAGIYLSRLFERKRIIDFILATSFGVLLLTWAANRLGYNEITNRILAIAVSLAIFGAIVSPFFMSKKSQNRTWFVIIFVPVLLLAFLYPTPPLHISAEYWQRQIRYRTAINGAAEFFQNNPGLPVIALSNSNAQELNFASNFGLGQVDDTVLIPTKGARIHILSDPRTTAESGYIYLRDEINHFSITPPNWWRVAQFDAGASVPIVIFRVLSKTDASAELAAALASLAEASSQESYARVLAAGVNAQDASAVILAWSELAKLAPDDYPITLVAPTLLSEFELGDIAHGENLLPDDLGQFEIDQGLRQTSDPEENTLSLKALDDSSVSPSVHIRLILQPNSAYVFFLDVKSDTGVDVLSVTDISDSHNYNETYGEWQTVSVVFITPQWPSEREVQFHLVVLHKAGSVSLRNPQLYLLETNQHE